MDGSKCVLQLRGVRPFLSDKYDITKHKRYRQLSDENPKNVFNINNFISRKLDVKPDEQYELSEYVEMDEEMPDAVFEDWQQDNDDIPPEDLEPV